MAISETIIQVRLGPLVPIWSSTFTCSGREPLQVSGRPDAHPVTQPSVSKHWRKRNSNLTDSRNNLQTSEKHSHQNRAKNERFTSL